MDGSPSCRLRSGSKTDDFPALFAPIRMLMLFEKAKTAFSKEHTFVIVKSFIHIFIATFLFSNSFCEMPSPFCPCSRFAPSFSPLVHHPVLRHQLTTESFRKDGCHDADLFRNSSKIFSISMARSATSLDVPDPPNVCKTDRMGFMNRMNCEPDSFITPWLPPVVGTEQSEIIITRLRKAPQPDVDPLFHGEPLGLVHFVGIIANSGAVKNGNAVAGMA